MGFPETGVDFRSFGVVSLVEAVEYDDYRPEYSLLVLRDPSVEWDHEEPEVPRYRDRGDEPTGTFAGTGAGWVTAQAPDLADHVVGLELHDSLPSSAAHAEFGDVWEAPYRSSSGGLSLTTLTGGVGPADFDLGDAEWYRVRVARRRADTGDTERYVWMLQFWPEPVLEPPVWLARSRSAIGPGDSGWHSALPGWASEVAYIAANMANRLGHPVTLQQVEGGYRTPHYAAGWLDAPLPSSRYSTTPGAPTYSPRLAQEQRRLDEIAAELRVAPVRRKRDVFPLMVAAGILVREGDDAYRAGYPVRIDTVLSLPPDQVEIVRERDLRGRYGAVAQDLEAVLRWTPEPVLATTADQLAERLLITETHLRDAVMYAEQIGLLHADGEQSLRLALGPRH